MEKEMEQREMSINNIYKAEDSNPSLVHNVVRERACEAKFLDVDYGGRGEATAQLFSQNLDLHQRIQRAYPHQ